MLGLYIARAVATLRFGLKWTSFRYGSLRYIWAAGGRGMVDTSEGASAIYGIP